MTDFLALIKLDLALRPENKHVGSGFGGNPTQYFYLLTHDIGYASFGSSYDYFKFSDGRLVFNYKLEENLKLARQSLNAFFEKFPAEREVTNEQITNPDYLKAIDSDSIYLKLLINALELCTDISNQLDERWAAYLPLSKSFRKEIKLIEETFLKEINLPIKTEIYSILKGMLEVHPVLGENYKDIDARWRQANSLLIGKSIIQKFEMLKTLPSDIFLLAIRSKIGVDKMANFNLNEKINFSDKIKIAVN